MDMRQTPSSEPAYLPVETAPSLTSDRIKALAIRVIESAPALTAGEMRELAEAILDHQARSSGQMYQLR